MKNRIGSKVHRLIYLFFLLFSFSSLALEVDVYLEPQNPIVGEPFFLIFNVSTDGDGSPYISFDQSDLIIQGKENRGHSRKVTIINGKLTSKSEAIYAYEVLAESSGSKRISNIKIDLDGKSSKVADFSFNVLNSAPKAQKIFLEAEVSKNLAYVGEGIDINYYLFYKVPVVQPQVEIKEYPKFDDFLKRFHMINQPIVETVQKNGEIYKKELRYSAKLFPTKAGKLKVGILKLKVPYMDSETYNRFGFGFGMRNFKTINLQNTPIEIDVHAVPSENMPKSYTSLIGVHDFKLTVKRTKFLVNEVLEYQLEVAGPGALELLEAPVIYNSDALENFDTKSEIVKINDSISKKVFSYTMLARAPINIDKSNLEFSYFDPSAQDFKKVNIEVPAVEIVGGAISSDTSAPASSDRANEVQGSDVVREKSIALVAPIFFLSNFNFKFRWLYYLNWILAVSIILILISFINLNTGSQKDKNIRQLAKKIKNKGPKYTLVYGLLRELKTSDDQNIFEAISQSQLSDNAKYYFQQTFKVSESSEFTKNQQTDKFKYHSGYFKELVKYISQKIDGNNKKSLSNQG